MPTGNPGSTLNDELNRLANGGTYPPISEYLDRAGAARKWAETDGIPLGDVTDLVGVLNLIAGITNRSQWLDLAGVCNFGAGTVGLEAAAALRTVGGTPPSVNNWNNYNPTITWNTVSPTAIWDNQ